MADAQSEAGRIGEVIRQARVLQRRSRKDVATALGYHQSKVSRLENGRGTEDVRVLREIAKVLDIPPQRLGLAAAPDASPSDPGTEDMHRRTFLAASVAALAATPTPTMAHHDLIQVLLPGPSPAATGDSSGIDELRERARTVRRLFCTCDYAKLDQALPGLIADLRQVADGSSGSAEASGLLATAYQTSVSLLLKRADQGNAWLAAGRAVAEAERSGDPVVLAASVRVPAETKQTLGAYAQKWLDANSVGPTTALRYEATVRNHIVTHLGRRELRSLNKPSVIQGWIRTLQDGGFEVSTIEGIFDILSSILGMAVEDGLLPKNPCRSKSVKLPTATKKKIVPWSLERVRAVIAGLPERFRAGGKLTFGCGLRQGEVFGFAVEDIDFRGGWIHVNRQVRLVGTKPVFALPKGNRIRSVPLSAQLATALKAHMRRFPPTAVTLPWAKPDGEPKTFRLLFVDEKGRAYNRSVFNMGAWKRALVAVGVIPPRERGARYLQAAPEDGMHALRHAYASVLLDAGESIKALSEYLGHSDPGFTLRTYTHLLPSSESRTRKAIDDAFTGAEPTETGEPQGTSPPPAKPMCPQCALAA